MTLATADLRPRGLSILFRDIAGRIASRRERGRWLRLEEQVQALPSDTIEHATVRLKIGGRQALVEVSFQPTSTRRAICGVVLSCKIPSLREDLEALASRLDTPPHPEWDAVWKQRHAEDRKISRALAAVGVKTHSIYCLVNDHVRYGPEVIEPLLRVLAQVREPHMRDGIFRALLSHQWPEAAREQVVDAILPDLVRGRDGKSRATLGYVLTHLAPRSRRALVRKALARRLTSRELAFVRATTETRRATSPIGTRPLRPLKRAAETSVNLDLEDLKGALRRISREVQAGFGAREIDRLMRMAKSMDVEEERGLDFPIRTDGEPARMQVRIFLDDVDAPDLYIRSDCRSLVRRLDALFLRF